MAVAQPIAQLAGLWRQTFLEWGRDAAEGRRPPVPPVFIVVCRDTRLAKVVYEWITGQGDTPAPLEELKNVDGREHTVRVDSRVVEDLATGVAKSDESRRLRFVLATIGKTAWPGGEPPEECLDLVDKINRKATEEGRPRIDASIPPGRDVRCIVSVAMLTEGWDATTVTHIVGLRPFESQLLCEQVIGRGLRRSQYHDLTVEEVAKVYGVPFELIPLKATPGTPTPPPKVHHVYALSPDRDLLEIRFPRVEGYSHRVSAEVRVAWERVPPLVLDPTKVPDETLVKALTTDRGQDLSLLGPGAPEHVTLEAWRATKRLQEVEFELARALTRRYAADPMCTLPAQALFPRMLGFARRFLREKVEPLGRRDRKDVLLNLYFTDAVEALVGAVGADGADSREVPRYEANRKPGSTRDVDFWTSKPVRETQKSHLNFVVADTEKWEQTAAFYLETDPHVLAYAKNFNLGFAIPYTHAGETREYLPDFLVRVQKDGREVGTLILETKGYDPLKHVKIGAALRWVEAVNAEGSWGRWAYRIVSDPTITPAALASAAFELANPPRAEWRVALGELAVGLRSAYGERLKDLVLYGSRARGDAEWDSDVDVLVVLDRFDDFWAEFDRINDVACDLFLKHGVLLSAVPTDLDEFSHSTKPLFVNARRDGKRVA
jgi:type III restriction enzyme